MANTLTDARYSHPDLHETIQVDRDTFYQAGPYKTATEVKLYREYAAGKQVLTHTEEQEAILDGITEHDFADNVCHQIIAEPADRIDMERYDCPDEAVGKFLTDLALRNRLDDFQGEVHYATLRDGNFCVSLAWDNDDQRVTLHLEPWWDGSTGVFIAYDVYGEPLYAVKEWETMTGRRRIVWFEDRIERYEQATGGAWFPYALPTDTTGPDGEAVPQEWQKPDGSPLHIPIVHFANGGRAAPVYGVSELAGGVIGFQDQINDLQYDISAAARMTGFQVVTASGVTLPTDAVTGELVSPAIGPGAVFTDPNPKAKWGTIPAGDITQLIATYETKLKAVSRATRTPLHLITGGDWPSGEALLRAEMPLVSKVGRMTRKIAPSWATIAHRATEIANTFGRANLNEDAPITPVFADPAKRDPLMLATVISTLGETLSLHEKLRLLGYSPDKIDAIVTEKGEEQKSGLTATPGQPPNGNNGVPVDGQITPASLKAQAASMWRSRANGG